MMIFILILFAVKISTTDFLTHLIRNRDVAILLLISLGLTIRHPWTYCVTLTFSFMIFFIVHAIFAIGMGDVKLISVLIAIMAPQTFNDISKIAILLMITSMVVAIPYIVASHSLRLRIPWAPSLFLATILYMATR